MKSRSRRSRSAFSTKPACLVAGSRRDDFPTEVELLLLRVAANQAGIGLQEARRSGEQKRIAETLEQRVAERTRQLTAVNDDAAAQSGIFGGSSKAQSYREASAGGFPLARSSGQRKPFESSNTTEPRYRPWNSSSNGFIPKTRPS